MQRIVDADPRGNQGPGLQRIAATIVDDLRIEALRIGDLELLGEVAGNLSVRYQGELDGKLVLGGTVAGTVYIGGPVAEDIVVSGHIQGHLIVRGSVGGGVFVQGQVSSTLFVGGAVKGDVVLAGLAQQVVVRRSVGRDLRLEETGEVLGSLVVRPSGVIGRDFEVEGRVGADVDLGGRVSGVARINGLVAGDVVLTGLTSGLALCGRVEGGARIIGPERARTDVLELNAAVDKPVHLGERVSLSKCDFRGYNDFDKLRFVGSELFDRKRGWQLIDHNPDGGEPISARELAGTYRQLRRVFESQSNRPGAADFYHGEMTARRAAAIHRFRLSVAAGSGRGLRSADWAALGESVIITMYSWLSAYGLRAWLPVGWLAVAVLLASLLFGYNGLDLDARLATVDSPNARAASSGETIWFAIQSLVSVVSSPAAELGTWGRFLQIACRFTGPILIAQAVLAVRERVAR